MAAVRQKFGRGVAWMAAGNWIEQAVNFAVFIALARLLDSAAFGLMAMASVVIVLAEFLVRETFTEHLIADDSPGAEDFNAVFWALTGLGVGLSVLILALARPIATAYGEDMVAPLIWWMVPAILMTATTAVPVAVLRRELAFRSLSLRAIAGVVGGGMAGLSMALAGYGVWALVGQRVIQVLVNELAAWIAVPWRPGLGTSRAHLRRVLQIGGQAMALRASELAITQVPTVVLGRVLGPVATGYYTIAWRLIETASFLIVTPLRMASQPAFAALRREGQGGHGSLLSDLSRISSFLAFPAFAGLAALAAPVLLMVFGPGWTPAAQPLAVLGVAGAYYCVEKVQLSFGLAMGRAGAFALLGWATVAALALACGIAVHRGAPAVAAAFVGTLLAFWPLRTMILSRLSGVSVPALFRPHLLPLLGAVPMALIVAQMPSHLWHLIPDARPVVVVLVAVATGVTLYAGFTLIFMRDRLKLFLALFSNVGN
jgi:PST family polysaccharide transporter